MNVATVDANQRPQVRTVVLQEAYPLSRQLDFYTDARSQKWAELKAHNPIALHFHSNRHRVQIRLAGLACFRGEQARSVAWKRLHEGAKGLYAQSIRPGLPIAAPQDGSPSILTGKNQAYAKFAVVNIQIESLDWLELDREIHRRALFRYKPGGEFVATWLAP